MVETIFLYLSIIIWSAIIILWIMKLLKQPLIIWYIITWTLISITIPQLLHENTAIETFSSIWVSFLLFIVWLELNPKIIKDIWKSSILTWFLQVIITAILWFWLSKILNFDTITSIFLWIWFSFSSTIVILKLLWDKWETQSSYSRLSMWILIIQDLIVMLSLLWLSTFKHIQLQWWSFYTIWSLLILKILWIWLWLFLLNKYILPTTTKKIADSQEYLFLFSIWRCLIMWMIFYILWFSIEIWALVAWISLANLDYKYEIISKIKPLRDFFIIMFFVLLWSNIIFPIPKEYIITIILFSIFIIIIKPLITLLILWLFKNTKKNNFLTATTLWQVSEFSFLLITIWITNWYIKDNNWLLSIITIIWLVSITISSYFILYWKNIRRYIKKYKLQKIIPWKKNKMTKKSELFDIILLWYWRYWQHLYKNLIEKNNELKTLIIDENPDVIEKLKNKKINNLYWDVWELDFLEEINIRNSKIIISTIKNYDDNVLLTKYSKKQNKNIIIIIISQSNSEAIKYYDIWADYVILPHHLWANHTSMLIKNYWFDINKFIKEWKKHKEILQKIEKK